MGRDGKRRAKPKTQAQMDAFHKASEAKAAKSSSAASDFDSGIASPERDAVAAAAPVYTRRRARKEKAGFQVEEVSAHFMASILTKCCR